MRNVTWVPIVMDIQYDQYMSNHRTIDLDSYSEVYGALSNPNRLRLLLRIFDQCRPDDLCATSDGMGACVGELADGLDIAPSTVSHHLKELRRVGLISMTRQGRTVECAVNTEALAGLSSLFDQSPLANSA